MPKSTSDCRATERKHPWPMVRLGDVCDEIKDRIQSSKISVGEYVTTDNMVKDRGGIVPAEYVPSDVGLVEYHKDDVLIANIRPYLKKIWLADHDGGCSSDVVVFRSNTDGLSSEYLYSVLSQDAYFEYVMQKPRGTKMPRGDRDWMKEFRFPLPSLSVQREIVSRLERELVAVEKMKKGFETLAETAKAEFKAELKEVFEDSRYALEPLSKYCSFTGGSQPPKSSFIYEPKDGYVRLYQIRDYNGDPKPTYIKASDAKKTSRRGDIMIGRYGASIGLVFWAEDGAYNVAMVKVLINSSAILPEFVFEALHTPRIQSVFRSASRNAQAGFNESEWNKMKLPVPPLSAQREVVARLDSAKARAEKLEAKAREGVAVCETMRKAILKEVFE